MSPVTLPKALINPLRILFGYVILPMTDSRNHKSSAEFCHINQKEALFMPCLILLLSALLTSVQILYCPVKSVDRGACIDYNTYRY